MMYLTKTQIKKIRELKRLQYEERHLKIVPTIEEAQKIKKMAPKMTLKDFLALPDEERRKWCLCNIPEREVFPVGTDSETGEAIYVTGYYFEPWDPNFYNRIY